MNATVRYPYTLLEIQIYIILDSRILIRFVLYWYTPYPPQNLLFHLKLLKFSKKNCRWGLRSQLTIQYGTKNLSTWPNLQFGEHPLWRHRQPAAWYSSWWQASSRSPPSLWSYEKEKNCIFIFLQKRQIKTLRTLLAKQKFIWQVKRSPMWKNDEKYLPHHLHAASFEIFRDKAGFT